MAAYCLYGINFYDEALESVNTFLKKYPADKNIVYAHYLIAIIYFEQIADEKKDLEPLLKAKEKINFFIQKYPDNDYSLDLSHGGSGDYRESKGRTEQGEIEAMLESTFLLPVSSTTKEATERAMSVGVKLEHNKHQVPENWELKSGGYVAEFGQGSKWNK